ncbi:unnamed protein product [Amoebophrya sp. A25]|nr:unnamed protein product [Amoebophrya sp. A25]|eukprot:GSA25T00002634001.1
MKTIFQETTTSIQSQPDAAAAEGWCKPPEMVVAESQSVDHVYQLWNVSEDTKRSIAMSVAMERQGEPEAPLHTCLNTPEMYKFLKCEEVYPGSASRLGSCRDVLEKVNGMEGAGVPKLIISTEATRSGTTHRFVMTPKMEAKDAKQFWRKEGTLCNTGKASTTATPATGYEIIATALAAVDPAAFWEVNRVKSNSEYFPEGHCAWIEDQENRCKKTVCEPSQ